MNSRSQPERSRRHRELVPERALRSRVGVTEREPRRLYHREAHGVCEALDERLDLPHGHELRVVRISLRSGDRGDQDEGGSGLLCLFELRASLQSAGDEATDLVPLLMDERIYRDQIFFQLREQVEVVELLKLSGP